jgi:uncharacterized protein YjbI with pentapeptide repeats
MANPEHLKILKQGVRVWNEWRRGTPQVIPDLLEADLRLADLSKVDLSKADGGGVRFGGAKLSGADLHDSNLRDADLGGADLMGADLSCADLTGADLSRANLADARLTWTNLTLANLCGASLTGADLKCAVISSTTFGDNDLSEVKGLETVRHMGPSTIGIDTIYKSKGNIPEVFLRGCGVPEDFILYMKSLVGKPIEFYSCFISYSSKDDDFAQRLHADLQAQNVRCWFAPEHLKIGDKFQDTIEESIRWYDKLLLALSENSIESAWVEQEVQAALEKERKSGKLVLFPVRLDEAVMATSKAWAANLRRTRHIGDFTRWKDHDAYQQAFQLLLRDLKAEAASSK